MGDGVGEVDCGVVGFFGEGDGEKGEEEEGGLEGAHCVVGAVWFGLACVVRKGAVRAREAGVRS